MQLFVKTLNGKTIALDVMPSSTVNDVKGQINDIIHPGFQRLITCGICKTPPYDPLRLIYGGKELENAKSLFDYDIRQESILYLVHRMHRA